MLSIAKLAKASTAYYAREASGAEHGYYVEQGNGGGVWLGSGLGELGLASGASVSEEAITFLFAGAHPVTGEKLGRGFTAAGVRGFDLTMSAPKSVSALMAIAPAAMRQQVLGAHRAAVTATLAYLETHAAWSRIGAGGIMQVPTRGLAVAVYDHFTSRCGDPQLHSHCVVSSKVRCDDGEWRSLDGRELYAHARSAGMLYQAGLRVELSRRLGISFATVDERGQAEIAGMPAALLDRWSSRRRDIEKAAHHAEQHLVAFLGRDLTSAERRRLLEEATLATRPVKRYEEVSLRDLRWRAEAEALGQSLETLAPALVQAAPTAERRLDPLAEVSRERATFTRPQLAEVIATTIGTSVAPNADAARLALDVAVNAQLSAPEAVALTPPTEVPADDVIARSLGRGARRYATVTGMAIERAILDRALEGIHAGTAALDRPLLESACAHAQLGDDQREAVLRLGSEGAAIAVLEAPAGAGKTTALRPLTRTWEAEGYTVFGMAPSARAAEELARSTGCESSTVAKALLQLENGSRRLTQTHVVVVDEAGMLSRDDLDALSRQTVDAGAKLVLVGDSAQIPAVKAPSGMLQVLGDQLGRAELTEVRRFTNAWEAEASLALRDRRPDALEPYLEHDRIHTAPTEQAALDAAFAQWSERRAAGVDVLLMARSRVHVDELNDRARAQAVRLGDVSGPVIRFGGREWQAGDHLIARRNDPSIRITDGRTLVNGDRFVVTDTSPQGIDVRHLGNLSTCFLPSGYVATSVDRGWATTVDSAQGMTSEECILVSTPGIDSGRLYVGFTRGRQSNDWHVSGSEVPGDLPLLLGEVGMGIAASRPLAPFRELGDGAAYSFVIT